MNTKNRLKSVLSPKTRLTPCKCDHCPWQGTVDDTIIIDKKATCPQCGGSLAANRPIDQIIDVVKAADGAMEDGWDD